MKEYSFYASFGHEIMRVSIDQPHGNGGRAFNIQVNGYYWGCVVPWEDKWSVRMHRPPGWFTKADIDEIMQYMDRMEPIRPHRA